VSIICDGCFEVLRCRNLLFVGISIVPLFLLFLNLLQLSQALLLLNNQGIFVETVYQMLTHFLVGCLAEFEVLPAIVEVPVEGSLERKAVHDVELLIQHDPCRLSLAFLILELARMVSKLLSLLAEQLWNDSRPVVFIRGERGLRPVDEHILLPRVAMHVDVSQDVLVACLCPLLGFAVRIMILILYMTPTLAMDDVINEALDCQDFWMQARVRLVVASVQIIARH